MRLRFEQLCNKTTYLYLLFDAKQNRLWIPLSRIVQALNKEWFRVHTKEPSLKCDQFFATPVRVLEDRPTSIAGIVQVHRNLCEKSTPVDWHVERRRVVWPNEHEWTIDPLFRAVIVVLDELYDCKDIARDSEGMPSLDDLLEKQSVVLVRTGNESELSAPTPFEGLRSFSNQPDTALQSDTIRVSLETVVKFMVNLSQREETARLRELAEWQQLDNDSTSITRCLSLAKWASLLKDWEKNGDKSFDKEEALSFIDFAKWKGIDQVFELRQIKVTWKLEDEISTRSFMPSAG